MKKRGMSNIIAMLLVIMIVLIATAIIWFVIRNIIQSNADEISLQQFTIDLKIESLRITNETLNAKIKRNPGDGDLKGITFLVFDGRNTYIFEKMDVGLNPLAIKTFIIDYTETITKLSIAPIFETEQGKLVTGSIVDVYYVTGFGAFGGGDCIDACESRECGPDPNACLFSCGTCPPTTPACIDGLCEAGNDSCDCSCALNICNTQNCTGGCGEICQGQLDGNYECTQVECGPDPICGVECVFCETGYHCDGNACVVDCIPDCGTRDCGTSPNNCGENECGVCDVENGWWCDEGHCSNGTCIEECGTRVCGPGPICGFGCGDCNETLDEWCSDEGQCLFEQPVNNGTVFSVWPLGTGIYFDSEDLPKVGVDYTQYFVRFPGGIETRCLQIHDYIIPLIPEVYNMSHIKFITSYTAAQDNDKYEVWWTYKGCTNAQS